MLNNWLRRSFIALACFSMTGLAASGFLEPEFGDPPDLFQFGVGVFNIRRARNRQPQASFEYKWRPVVYTLRALVGIMMTSRGSGYIYGGAGLDLFLTKRLVLTPSFAPGLYWRGGGKEKGFPLEFRSSIELAGVFKNHARLGVQFYHISNASMGWKNPGEESLVLFVALPLRLCKQSRCACP